MTDDRQNQIDEHARERAGRDFDDLNNEVAGRHHGRIKRFTGEDSLNPASTKVSRDFDLMLEVAAQQQLTATQQRELQRLNQRLNEYDRATDKALAEIDRELAQAREEYQRIQENATVLSDGRRVYRDVETGHFYDENDQRLSEEEQLEAREQYQEENSSRQQIKTSANKIETLKEERNDVKEFKARKDELERRAEQNPEDAPEIEKELDALPAPERVRQQLTNSPQPSQNFRNDDVGTSAAKTVNNDGIETEIALAPAFHRAGAAEQPSANPAQPAAPGENSPKQDTGLGLG